MTYTTLRRRTILQFLQILLTDARTFIAFSRGRSAPATLAGNWGAHVGGKAIAPVL